jgi:hypothetical protein
MDLYSVCLHNLQSNIHSLKFIHEEKKHPTIMNIKQILILIINQLKIDLKYKKVNDYVSMYTVVFTKIV